MTEWKAIPGFGNYECTRDGRFRSLARWVDRGKGRYFKDTTPILPTSKAGSALRFCMVGDDGPQTVTPQRLIYLTFIGTIPDDYGAVLIDSALPATADNVTLRRLGNRYSKEARARRAMEHERPPEPGYCELMGKFLRMRTVQ